MKNNKTKLIVALDVESLKEAEKIVDLLAGTVDFFKIGSQLFTAEGPKAVEMVLKKKAEVFLDLKFHDIPNTVSSSAISAMRLGVSIFNVHACGGKAMLLELMRCVEAETKKSGLKKPLILGITVLTSIDRQQLNSLGIMRSVKNQVVHLAKLCKECGLDGVVCSGKELELIKRVLGKEFICLVPGVRPLNAAFGDQKRVVTPEEASKNGADYIVVGRPITGSDNPLKTAQEIIGEISSK